MKVTRPFNLTFPKVHVTSLWQAAICPLLACLYCRSRDGFSGTEPTAPTSKVQGAWKSLEEVENSCFSWKHQGQGQPYPDESHNPKRLNLKLFFTRPVLIDPQLDRHGGEMLCNGFRKRQSQLIILPCLHENMSSGKYSHKSAALRVRH